VSFQPVLPASGYAGWRFLSRTAEGQRAAFNKAPAQARLTQHFRDNIGKAKTAADLVGDRRLLQVALGAFGLSDDLNAKAFIQRVLEGGTLDPRALANRLSDKRYAALALEFGYGDLGSRTATPGFADTIVARFEAQSFQVAVGEKDANLRLALSMSSGLKDVVEGNRGENAQWFALMGNPPLRTVVETALGLPSSFGRLDIDQQLGAFKDRASAVLGTNKVADFQDSARQEKLIRLFLVRSEAQSASLSPAQLALSLLAR
jgi:hypothetical protein